MTQDITLSARTVNTTPDDHRAQYQDAIALLQKVPVKAWCAVGESMSGDTGYFTLLDSRRNVAIESPTFLIEIDLLTGEHLSRELEYRNVEGGSRVTYSFTGPEVEATLVDLQRAIVQARTSQGDTGIGTLAFPGKAMPGDS